ncbi:MAG: ribosomal-protein-alanine N-acetyltransferase [Roseobacter sp.]|jgi:ribosomal-protein-alanine N-acetyltransferase|uniref:ribosomal protein S18-alanine N-acetyltransferase n=2 Tax=Sulfitobacter pontiacus TaxID=60137 RepID=UPI000C63EF0A|nr:ribosomal protein S18-alanine N-acetyltransferase [uncultured Sulfitobacter sp.]MBG64462.1 ribosomal-protein-alanine N-acetyltransferase [Roseobacter sp.]HBM40944.1 ribosomal-protein-alanine N-acetyltransferase [Sulfitobacter sp.]
MTPQDMARIHAAAFVHDRAWTAQEIADLLASPFVTYLAEPQGFALTRLIAGEAELLTLAVDPAAQRQGIGRRLLQRWMDGLEAQADTAFLEVAADNTAAIALYTSAGFRQTATRRGYYQRKDAPSVDALILSRQFTHG